MTLFRILVFVSVFTLAAFAQSFPAASSFPDKPLLKIAVLSSPEVIGKYSQSVYNVSLATLMGIKNDGYAIKNFTIPDESVDSLAVALDEIAREGTDGILAPLTASGVKNLLRLNTATPIFIPTAHKRDFPAAPGHIAFGAIDYERQIEALLPYMSDSIAVFYDNSAVGMQLNGNTEEVFFSHRRDKKSISTYPVDPKGENILTYLSKPAQFNKKSIILHIPVVKSALLASHLTFNGIKERNILSTQINVDPTLLTLTQYNDRNNMILANSLVEFPEDIYEANALMNNDIVFDWVNYAASVGIDYLASSLASTPRRYTMRIVNAQVIYPIVLLRAQEFGFEPLNP